MFEGSDYVMTEIIWWMAASAVVGFGIGWILRRFFVARRYVRRLRAAHDRIAELEARLDPGGGEGASGADDGGGADSDGSPDDGGGADLDGSPDGDSGGAAADASPDDHPGGDAGTPDGGGDEDD